MSTQLMVKLKHMRQSTTLAGFLWNQLMIKTELSAGKLATEIIFGVILSCSQCQSGIADRRTVYYSRTICRPLWTMLGLDRCHCVSN